MKLRKVKINFNASTVVIIIVLMAVTFLVAPYGSTQEKDNLTTFIEKKLAENLNDVRAFEIQHVAKTITDGAKTSKLDPLLILAMMEHESLYQTDAIGRHGEIGLLQIRPETAKWLLERNDKIWAGKNMLFDPKNNVQIGIMYLEWLNKKFNNTQVTLAAYNMGPYATQKYLKKKVIPQVYYNKVYSKFQGLLMEYDTYQVSINPNAKPGQLTASN
jgi:soluble lytic murein transglycosylase-like protein